ncbi:bacteriophage antitermination protein Q [Ewingella americana]|uniref:bacteriophage antitermination protein Q n=1 Tax=Ewingella americana TaxID=41202 RepID=UPI0016399482|nr:bacteriophage antitermination protein Q [Ewingella americana]QMV50941.1 antitermination protein [Ewingella americana]
MNIDYIRERVITALADHSGATKGQLAAFEEHAPADTASKKRKRIHFVQLEKRRVSADIEPVSCTETRSRVKPLPPIHEITFCSSSWRRAVSSMEGERLAWIRYCYGYDLTYSHQVTICQHIWAEFERRCRGKKVTAKKRARLSSLVWLAVQTYASQGAGRIANEYSAGDLASLSGVSKSNWAENYATQWEELLWLCNDLDVSALREIISKRSEARSKILTT